MKKVKFLVVMSLIFILSVFMFSGCKKRIFMDVDKCSEVALEYMENKYQTEFEVVHSGEVGKFIGTAGYAKVKVSNKYKNTENEYIVVVYPDDSIDKDEDGYYDSYKVISDTYMCYLLQDYIKSEMDELLIEVGVTRLISGLSIKECGEIKGFLGFSNDFPIQREEEISLINMLNNYNITIQYWVEVPENENVEMLQSNMINVLKPLVSDDLISVNVEVYSEDVYMDRQENYEKNEFIFQNNRTNILKGIKSFYFSISDEEKVYETK